MGYMFNDVLRELRGADKRAAEPGGQVNIGKSGGAEAVLFRRSEPAASGPGAPPAAVTKRDAEAAILRKAAELHAHYRDKTLAACVELACERDPHGYAVYRQAHMDRTRVADAQAAVRAVAPQTVTLRKTAAESEIERIAADLRKSDPRLTVAQSIERAALANPHLYAADYGQRMGLG